MTSFDELLDRSSLGAAARMRAFGQELKGLRHDSGKKLSEVATWAGLSMERAMAIECGTTGGFPEDPGVTEAELRRYLRALDVEQEPWVEKLRKARTG